MQDIKRSDSCYVNFYRGLTNTKIENRSIYWLINYASNDQLEKDHGYIQWIFPGTEPSKAQPGAVDQLLTKQAVEEMLGDCDIVNQIQRMVIRMFNFWGLQYTEAGPIIIHEPTFKKKLACRFDHNQLRMTRMLKFFRHLRWDTVADKTKEFLLPWVNPRSKTHQFWSEV